MNSIPDDPYEHLAATVALVGDGIALPLEAFLNDHFDNAVARCRYGYPDDVQALKIVKIGVTTAQFDAMRLCVKAFIAGVKTGIS